MIELGDLRTTATGLRRFLLFQSLSQVISWLAIVALVTTVLQCAIYLSGDHQIFWRGIVIGAVCALPSVWLARPASFRVRGPGRAQAWSVAEGFLCVRVYRPAIREADVHVYQPRLPRWLRWNEQDVRMAMDRDGMLVSGPYVTLLGLRRLLAATFAS